MRVLIAGEGKNEVGGWFDHPAWHPDQPQEGVVEALLRRVRADGWTVVKAVRWHSIPKLRVGKHGDVELRNVRGLLLHAREREADVVAFVRDRDAYEPRETAIESAIQEQHEVRVIGGVVIERLEDWMLTLHASGPLRMRPELPAQIREKSTEAMVEVVRSANLDAAPADLRRWLARAQVVLTTPASG